MKFSRQPSGTSTTKSSTKFGKSRTQANVAGYEKRQARKTKSANTTSDLYEHIPEKTRRSKVTLELDHDEAMEYGVGIDGANEEEREQMRARLIGEGMDDEEIASDEDEEIDSDAAFEESDEERFAGFFSSKKSKSESANKQKSKSSVRFAEVDLNENEEDLQPNGGGDSDEESEEEEEEEGDDDEFIDLLDVLDGKGDIDMGSDDDVTKKATVSHTSSVHKDGSELEEDEESSEDDSEVGSDEGRTAAEDEKMAFAPSEDDEAPEALDQLQQFVSGLDVTSKKRKAPEDSSTVPNSETRERKRRLIKERTEAGDENEFRAHSSGSKLNLEDLLTPLASHSTTLQSLKKSTKVLAPSSCSKTKTLSAPLPQRTQERMDRMAAYEQTKGEVDKWSDTMKRIREAEHLSFPLQTQSSGRTSNLELNAKFKPTTEMESAVDALLKSAKMREEDIHHTEDTMLQMNKLSVEEVAQRRGELRKMRDLVFRAEIKARRVKKIKSKTYRRIRRKEQERLGEKINEGEESDNEESKLKQDHDRARERATLRHKHTGKWARQMRNKEGLDEGSRRDIEEMLSRGEKLRRRIKGVESDDSEGDEDEDDSDDDGGLDVEGGIEKIKQDAFEELRRLDGPDGTEGGEKRKGKSIFEMKFMKDAMSRQAEAANKEVDDFIKEMGGDVRNCDGSDEEGDTQEVDPSSGVVSERKGGRLIFRPGVITATQSSSRELARPPSDTSSVTLKSTDLLSPPPPSPQINRSPLSGPPTEESNPWLVRASKSAAKVSKKVNEVIVSKDSKAVDKSKNKLKKLALRKRDEKEKAKDDAVVEISLDTVLTSSSTAVPSSSNVPLPIHKANSMNGKGASINPALGEDDSDDSEANVEIEAQEQALGLKGKGKVNGIKAFKQRDLVALAFAGDNVVSSFEEAKRREIASDAPREVDTTIPGWGSWGGTGTRKAPTKPHRIKKIAGIDPTTRADYNKHNIIISEKRDKKAGKYLVKDLPYPYTSKAQFERAMERPLGAEWNTRVGFQRATLPRVVMKPGIIIDPLEKQHS